MRAGENVRFLLEAGGEDYKAHARWGELQTAYTGSRVVPGWTIDVRRVSDPNPLPGYRALFALADGLLTSQMMEVLREGYGRRGLPEATIAAVAGLVGMPIHSSTNAQALRIMDNEARYGGGERVWQRLTERGRARYDETLHRFVYVPSPGVDP